MDNLDMINGEEAVKMAIALEEDGQRFYDWAAGQVEGGSAVMFRRFAEDEREHARVFQRIIIDSPVPIQPLFDDREGEAYLGALIEDTVFPGVCQWEKRIQSLHDPISIVQSAIQAEKDSIRLYTEMMIQAKSMEAKKTLRAVMEEEKGHLAKLEKYLVTLS